MKSKIERLNKNEEVEKESESESELDKLVKLYKDVDPILARTYAKQLLESIKISKQRDKELKEKHPEYYGGGMSGAVTQNQMEKKEIEEMLETFKKFSSEKPSVPGSWFDSVYIQFVGNKKFICAWIKGYNKDRIIDNVGTAIVDPETGKYWEELWGNNDVLE